MRKKIVCLTVIIVGIAGVSLLQGCSISLGEDPNNEAAVITNTNNGSNVNDIHSADNTYSADNQSNNIANADNNSSAQTYSTEYIDVTGRTVKDVAKEAGYTLQGFLKEYGLPEDMPADTSETEAYYTVPTARIAEAYNMDIETLKDVFQLDDSITGDTPWGVAEGEITLGVYVGYAGLEEFKNTYGLDDNVTAATKWKEVRNAVDMKKREENQPLVW